MEPEKNSLAIERSSTWGKKTVTTIAGVALFLTGCGNKEVAAHNPSVTAPDRPVATAEPVVEQQDDASDTDTPATPTTEANTSPTTAPTETSSQESDSMPGLSTELITKIDILTPEKLYKMTPDQITQAFTINISDLNPSGDKSPTEIAEAYAETRVRLVEKLANAGINTEPIDGMSADDWNQYMVDKYAVPAHLGLSGGHPRSDATDRWSSIFNETYIFTSVHNQGFAEGSYEGFTDTYQAGSVELISGGSTSSSPMSFTFLYDEFRKDYQEELDINLGPGPAWVGIDRTVLATVNNLRSDSNGVMLFDSIDTEIIEDRSSRKD